MIVHVVIPFTTVTDGVPGSNQRKYIKIGLFVLGGGGVRCFCEGKEGKVVEGEGGVGGGGWVGGMGEGGR